MGLYTYITDLPPQIRDTLPIPVQQAWLDAFNMALNTMSEAEAYQAAWSAAFTAAFGTPAPDMTASPAEEVAEGEPDSSVQGVMFKLVPVMCADGTLKFSNVTPSESHRLGYWVDLENQSLQDVKWIQALPLGKYQHPIYGPIDVTPERVARMAANVKDGVRGTELDIDYDHKDKTGEAAGWVKDAEARSNGLWVLVDWTQQAAQKIKDKAYKYFSPEYATSWTHPKTGVKHKDVLFGGALTNRPFLKDILPINMSELFPQGGSMNKELAKLLGLAEDADEATIQTAVTAKLSENTELTTKLAEAEKKLTPEPKPDPKLTEPTADDIKKLAETDPVVRALTERLAVVESANTLSEVTLKLSEIEKDGKYAIPPAIADKVKSIALSDSDAAGQVIEILAEIGKVGLVKLGETKTAGIEGDAMGTATQQITKLAEAKVKEGMSFTDAFSAVAAENRELFIEYRNESYVKEGAK